MKQVSRLPDLNREFLGLSDAVALQAETDGMRDQLAAANDQSALERELAAKVHRARSVAILGSPALRLVYDIEDLDDTWSEQDRSIDIAAVLSSAFVRDVETKELPDGFTETIAKRLRRAAHPDVGGDTVTAQKIGGALKGANADPAFSVSSAILSASSPAVSDTQMLRDERYRLSIALEGIAPIYDDAEAVTKSAEAEISGAPWRVRTQAAFKTFELIIGDSDTWNRFLNEIVRERHSYLIGLVNRLQPAILTLQERLAKGDPLGVESMDIDIIDGVFERVWSTLGAKDRIIPYSPPYQNWLEVLLPAMQKLDPGQKPGEEYTDFEPPIQVGRTPQHTRDYGYGRGLGKSLFDERARRYETKDPYYKENFDEY